jgi:hypothetical protein
MLLGFPTLFRVTTNINYSVINCYIYKCDSNIPPLKIITLSDISCQLKANYKNKCKIHTIHYTSQQRFISTF